MRTAVGTLAALGAFATVLILGGKAFGVWDPVSQSPQIAIQGPRAQEAKFRAPKATTRKDSSRRSANRLAARERLRGRDMKVARAAVLHQTDMNGDGWVRIRTSSEAGQRCDSYNPDLSRFTVTGKARSAFKGGASYIESRSQLFPDALEAQRYFEARFGPRSLPCDRDAVKRSLAEAGLHPRVLASRYSPAPNVGDQTATYVIEYAVTARGKRFSYPVEVIAFRTSRAVGSVWFVMVPSADGQRPCECEYYEARTVEARLGRA
jgi:hypothetical protein